MCNVEVPLDHPRAPQIKVSLCQTPRAPSVRRKSSPVALRKCAPATDPHSPTVPTPEAPSVPLCPPVKEVSSSANHLRMETDCRRRRTRTHDMPKQ